MVCVGTLTSHLNHHFFNLFGIVFSGKLFFFFIRCWLWGTLELHYFLLYSQYIFGIFKEVQLSSCKLIFRLVIKRLNQIKTSWNTILLHFHEFWRLCEIFKHVLHLSGALMLISLLAIKFCLLLHNILWYKWLVSAICLRHHCFLFDSSLWDDTFDFSHVIHCVCQSSTSYRSSILRML